MACTIREASRKAQAWPASALAHHRPRTGRPRLCPVNGGREWEVDPPAGDRGVAPHLHLGGSDRRRPYPRPIADFPFLVPTATSGNLPLESPDGNFS